MEAMEMTTVAATADKESVPQGWKRVRIKDIAQMGTGHTPSTKKPSYYGDDILWISLQDTKRLDNHYINETTIRISEEGLRNCSAVRLSKDTVAVLRTGNVGKVAILGQIMAVSQDYVTWTCGKDVLPEFLYYAFQGLKPDFEQQANGSTVRTLGLPFFEKLHILLPPISEQKQIIAVLKSLDEAATSTQKLLIVKRSYKRGLMHQLLTGQQRFPEFQGQPWREFRLGEVFKDFSQLNRSNEDLPILSCSKVYGIVLQETLFGRRIASEDIRRYKVVTGGDLVYDPMLLWDASLGFVASVPRGVISPAYVTLRYTGDAETKALLEQALYSEEMRFQYKLISRGTNVRRQKAPAEDFLKIKLSLPASSIERGKIAAVLTACDQEIDLLQAQLRQWQQQKKGLMQQLLTGQLRVPNI